jgi:hypothetical protein
MSWAARKTIGTMNNFCLVQIIANNIYIEPI